MGMQRMPLNSHQLALLGGALWLLTACGGSEGGGPRGAQGAEDSLQMFTAGVRAKALAEARRLLAQGQEGLPELSPEAQGRLQVLLDRLRELTGELGEASESELLRLNQELVTISSQISELLGK